MNSWLVSQSWINSDPSVIFFNLSPLGLLLLSLLLLIMWPLILLVLKEQLDLWWVI